MKRNGFCETNRLLVKRKYFVIPGRFYLIGESFTQLENYGTTDLAIAGGFDLRERSRNLSTCNWDGLCMDSVQQAANDLFVDVQRQLDLGVRMTGAMQDQDVATDQGLALRGFCEVTAKMCLHSRSCSFTSNSTFQSSGGPQ